MFYTKIVSEVKMSKSHIVRYK